MTGGSRGNAEGRGRLPGGFPGSFVAG
jgi:hypothetical protein